VVPGVVGHIHLLPSSRLNLLADRFAAVTLILAALCCSRWRPVCHPRSARDRRNRGLTLGGLLLVDGPIPELRVHLWTALGVSVPLGVITVFS